MPDITYDVGRVSFVMKGAWNLATSYEKLDAVTNNGSLYIAKQNVPGGTAISNTTYWQLAAEKGDQGPTGGVNSVNGRTGAVTGLAEEDAVGGTLRQLLAESRSIPFDDTAYLDMGSLTWNYSSGEFYASITDIKPSTTNILCTKYRRSGGSIDKSIVCVSYILRAYDSAYTDKDTFKASLKGVLLAYEKV